MWSVSRLMKMKTRNIESNHFKLFRKLIENLPKGEVLHEDNPDFWLLASKCIIGIEHCLVHKQNSEKIPPQTIENQTDEIISMAQEHAELQSMPAIHATFLFNHNRYVKKNEMLNLARKITKIINNELNNKKGMKTFQRSVIRQPNLPDQLSSIHFVKVKKDMRHFWRCARAGFAIEDCRDLLQVVINKKIKKLKSYLINCKECWLLMVAETKPSSYIHPNKESLEYIYISPFKRTYFLDCSLRKLHLLKTKKVNG